MTEPTMQIQVETAEQPADEEEGEQVQVRELAQQFEQLFEVTNMEMEQELKDQDIDLMPRASKVAP